MTIEFSEMTIADYDEVLALWKSVEGIGVNDADTRENTERYFVRNPGLSFVARDADKIVGAVTCGYDGRRGYLNHLAVAHTHRRQGIGKKLVDLCLAGLKAAGINKCNILVFGHNKEGLAFWESMGWEHREWLVMQKDT